MMWKTRQRSDFGALKAIRQGEGPTVILLHGVGLRAEAWNRQIDALANKFHVVAPDMPGHGEMQFSDTWGELAAYTDLVAGALTGPVWVAGHSMGAMIALDLAIRHPRRVKGVAALNAIYRRPAQAQQAVTARASALRDDEPSDPAITLQRWFDDPQSEEARACRQWLTGTDPAAYKQAYTIFAREDGPTDAGLSTLQAPALFITGADEPNSTPQMSRAMAALVPEGRAVIVDGAAHMMPMTHADEVNRYLAGLFTNCQAGRGASDERV